MAHTYPNTASATAAGAACPWFGRTRNTGRGRVGLGFEEALVRRRNR